MTKRKTNRKPITREIARQIHDLVNYGFTYTEVGKLYGKSRCAIGGFIYRAKHMGYMGKVEKLEKLEPYKPKATRIKNSVSLVMPPTTEGVTIFELKSDSCRYMIGHHKYCGEQEFNRSYCEYHFRECHDLSRKKK